jgi:hypothetical protein
MVGLWMNNTINLKDVGTSGDPLPGICLEGLWKSTRLYQDSRYPGPDLNTEYPANKA